MPYILTGKRTQTDPNFITRVSHFLRKGVGTMSEAIRLAKSKVEIALDDELGPQIEPGDFAKVMGPESHLMPPVKPDEFVGPPVPVGTDTNIASTPTNRTSDVQPASLRMKIGMESAKRMYEAVFDEVPSSLPTPLKFKVALIAKYARTKPDLPWLRRFDNFMASDNPKLHQFITNIINPLADELVKGLQTVVPQVIDEKFFAYKLAQAFLLVTKFGETDNVINPEIWSMPNMQGINEESGYFQLMPSVQREIALLPSVYALTVQPYNPKITNPDENISELAITRNIVETVERIGMAYYILRKQMPTLMSLWNSDFSEANNADNDKIWSFYVDMSEDPMVRLFQILLISHVTGPNIKFSVLQNKLDVLELLKTRMLAFYYTAYTLGFQQAKKSQ